MRCKKGSVLQFMHCFIIFFFGFIARCCLNMIKKVFKKGQKAFFYTQKLNKNSRSLEASLPLSRMDLEAMDPEFRTELEEVFRSLGRWALKFNKPSTTILLIKTLRCTNHPISIVGNVTSGCLTGRGTER